ncbi:MAG: hypothetical protein NVSMB1_06610 [Polyangiales bacterium]
MLTIDSIATSLGELAKFGPQTSPDPLELIEDKFSAVRSLPTAGTIGLYAVMVMAAFAFALSIAASKKPRLLAAARSAAYATCALVIFDLLLLAYAFVTHDFRIRYVARYSDRSMSTGYLITALWGGQDGSLLWWLFLLSASTTACVAWMRNRFRELQPYVIATLMTIMMFFVIIMTFSANPFAESVAGARADGDGLNPRLQNVYLIIHPPSLYPGFVSCSVPFAFGIAALASGRLDEEWLGAVRKWMLFAWVFLSIGNTLGMLWAYEELGWGGYWAWDPVENAAFMPWLTASAFVHSTMILERRRRFKVWNVVLICQTFFMTIVGTFLSRSGMIASVHAFAQSSIGIYFSYFMVTILSVTSALIVYRLPELKNASEQLGATRAYRRVVGPALSKMLLGATIAMIVVRVQTEKMVWVMGIAFLVLAFTVGLGVVQMRKCFPSRRPATLDSIYSREAAFVANNWVLVAMQAFVLLTTIFPLISETVTGEKVIVGPTFYSLWMIPLGLILFALMGIGPLLGWRKTSEAALRKAFRIPLMALAGAALFHFTVGRWLGYPAYVKSEPVYEGALWSALAAVNGVVPVIATSLAAFNIAVITQEYGRGIAARIRAHRESFFTALTQLVAKSRRRYGGYIVHAGIVVMFLGFTGSAYKVDKEFAMHADETVEFSGYRFHYLKPRMELDENKRMVFADVAVEKNGVHVVKSFPYLGTGWYSLGVMSPARFVYLRQQMPTTEIAIKPGFHNDVYIATGSISAETKLATLHIVINPITTWIWFGAMILILGAATSTWPEAALGEVGVGAYLRTAGATAASLVLGLLLALTPARAHASALQENGGSSLHAGNVTIKTPEEKRLFTNLRCMCGGCERLPLASCACGEAVEIRERLGARLASGESVEALTEEYVKQHGSDSITTPQSKGFLRNLWLVPTALIVAGAAGASLLVWRWTRPPSITMASREGKDPGGKPGDDYDAKLDAELKDLDD